MAGHCITKGHENKPVRCVNLCGKCYKRLQRGTYDGTAGRPRQHKIDLWLLPDDGLVDMLAVRVAANGYRPVRLTRTERKLAALQILEHGGKAADLYERLSLTSLSAAKSYVDRLRNSTSKDGAS